MKTEVVTLDQLKLALRQSPDSCKIRGKYLVDYRRHSVIPRQSTDEICKSTSSQDGLAVILELNDKPRGDAVERLLREPDNLVVAINTARYIYIAKRLSVNLAAKDCIDIKLHSNDLGEPSLWFDQVPQLVQLTAANADWWIDTQLKSAVGEKARSAIYEELKAKNLIRPVCAITGPSYGRIYVSETTLRRWLPKLPQDLIAAKLATENNESDQLPCIALNAHRDTLFALFGTTDTYLEAVLRF